MWVCGTKTWGINDINDVKLGALVVLFVLCRARKQANFSLPTGKVEQVAVPPFGDAPQK